MGSQSRPMLFPPAEFFRRAPRSKGGPFNVPIIAQSLARIVCNQVREVVQVIRFGRTARRVGPPARGPTGQEPVAKEAQHDRGDVGRTGHDYTTARSRMESADG